MKETYLGEFDEGYMTLVGITEEEAQATYESHPAFFILSYAETYYS